MRRCAFIYLVVLVAAQAVAQKKTINKAEANRMFVENVFHLSEVMLHDVANPPAAARFYAYSALGAYEAFYGSQDSMGDLKSRLNEKFFVTKAKVSRGIHGAFCANYALLDVGRQLMPSGYLLEEKIDKLVKNSVRAGILSGNTLQQNIRYAQEVASSVVKYARADQYNKLSTYTRYKPAKEDGHWYPTPPEYMGAVEPQWATVRPFFMDSAGQFKPNPPVTFSRDSSGEFYKLMHEVYATSLNLTEEQRRIANFWDCNPFAVTYSGHMAVGLKKISPGGHWMGITGIACEKAGMRFDSTVLVHAVVAMTIHDGFISCWNEKYRSDRIRPETAINKYLDASWRPLLQTPPFPEYTSGHSVVSACAASILTHFFGENFEFVDTSEVYFGIPERKFSSFFAAADEAAISRLYGGIHFRDACEQGAVQGRKLGTFVVDQVVKPLALPQPLVD